MRCQKQSCGQNTALKVRRAETVTSQASLWVGHSAEQWRARACQEASWCLRVVYKGNATRLARCVYIYIYISFQEHKNLPMGKKDREEERHKVKASSTRAGCRRGTVLFSALLRTVPGVQQGLDTHSLNDWLNEWNFDFSEDLTIGLGFPGGTSSKEFVCQRRRCKRFGFDSWVGKILWSRKQHPTPEFFAGEFHGQKSLVDYSPWGRWE